MKTRVAILDSHTMFLQAIDNYFKTKLLDIKTVSLSKNAVELFRDLRTKEVDVVMIELNIADRDGIEVLEDIKKSYAHVKVVILSAYIDIKFVRRAMQKGADAFLHKSNDIAELNKAIYEVTNGNTYLGESVRVSPEPNAASDSAERRTSTVMDSFVMKQKLTKREKQILTSIAKGKNNKEIGNDLYISYQTVGVHRKNIMKKLGVRNTVSLIKMALDRELV